MRGGSIRDVAGAVREGVSSHNRPGLTRTPAWLSSTTSPASPTPPPPALTTTVRPLSVLTTRLCTAPVSASQSRL